MTSSLRELTEKTFEQAYECGREACSCWDRTEQELIQTLLHETHELGELREDEQVLGLTPLVADGYAWVLGFTSGLLTEYAATRLHKRALLRETGSTGNA